MGELHNSYQKNRAVHQLSKGQMVMLKEEDKVSGEWSVYTQELGAEAAAML